MYPSQLLRELHLSASAHDALGALVPERSRLETRARDLEARRHRAEHGIALPRVRARHARGSR